MQCTRGKLGCPPEVQNCLVIAQVEQEEASHSDEKHRVSHESHRCAPNRLSVIYCPFSHKQCAVNKCSCRVLCEKDAHCRWHICFTANLSCYTGRAQLHLNAPMDQVIPYIFKAV